MFEMLLLMAIGHYLLTRWMHRVDANVQRTYQRLLAVQQLRQVRTELVQLCERKQLALERAQLLAHEPSERYAGDYFTQFVLPELPVPPGESS